MKILIFCVFLPIVNLFQDVSEVCASTPTQPKYDAWHSSPKVTDSQSLGHYADKDSRRSPATDTVDKDETSKQLQPSSESLEWPEENQIHSSHQSLSGDNASVPFADDSTSSVDDETRNVAISGVIHQELLPVFKEAMLGYYLKTAIHRPVCVLFRLRGLIPDLETQVHNFWAKAQSISDNLYTSWRLGAFFNQSKPTRGFKVPDTLPVLRCFIGIAQPADYRGPGKAKDLHRWLTKQAVKYKDRIPEFSSEALGKLPSSLELALVAFVDEDSHYDIESKMKELRESYKEAARVFMVHPGSDNAVKLMAQYGIQTLPAVVVLDLRDILRSRAVQKFEGPKSSMEHLRTFLSIRLSPVAILTLDNFESCIIRPKVKRSPTLVCFHAPWGHDTGSYLDALQRSAAEFHLQDGVGLEFGSVDLTKHAEVVTRWVDATYAKGVPFSVLFWWKETDDKGLVLHQKVFPEATPTPWSVATFLEQNQVPIYDAEGEELQYSPWAEEDIDDELAFGFSKYKPTLCTSPANSTLGMPDDLNNQDLCDLRSLTQSKRSKVKRKDKTEASNIQKSVWVKKKSSAASAQPMIGKIPQVTDASWSSIVERSRASGDTSRLTEPWRKDVASTTLVAFVQTDCSNCRRKMSVFERLVESLKMIGRWTQEDYINI